MTKDLIGAIAMDLKRAALGSEKSSNIFLKEAKKKRKEIKVKMPKYIEKILNNFGNDKEDLLMYSTLLQNYVRK